MRNKLAFALVALVSGCTAADVVVAESMPAASSSAGAGGGVATPSSSSSSVSADPPCTDNDDCDPNMFCARTACDAPIGVCALRPFDCPKIEDAVCGCDGVTYWNDCLRKQRGASAAIADECVHGKKCDADNHASCPAGAWCARLLPGDATCEDLPHGACWALPPACDAPDPDGEKWLSCVGPPLCLSTCDAIRTPQVFRATFTNECP